MAKPLKHLRPSDLRAVAQLATQATRGVATMAEGVHHAVLGTMGFVLAAMLLALLQEFGVAQKIVTARATGGDLRLWHGLGTLMVLGQWLCSGAVLWRTARTD
jgi:hypothetical protein